MISQTHGQTGAQVFVFNCGTHYSNGHFVIGKRMNRLQDKILEFFIIINFCACSS